MNNKRNVNLVCLFKGLSVSPSTTELGGYVDVMLSEPYSLATAYLKAYAIKSNIVEKNYNIHLLNLKDDGKGTIDLVSYQNEFLSKILSNNPIAIGFSTYCWNIDTTLILIKKIKKIRPNIKIILGGKYALLEYLLRYPEIDFIIRGEGEIAFKTLLENHLNKINIKGISFKIQNRLIDGGEGDIVKDIDDIPSPFTENIIIPNQYNMMIELSRGCLNNCGYCNWNSNKSLRYHSKKRIKEEIMYAISRKVKHITIIDSAINYNIILLNRFSNIIKHSPKNQLTFSYNLRYEHIDDNQIKYLKEIPSFQVLVGLETINHKALNTSNRSQLNIPLFENSIRLISSYCSPLIGIILGLPNDNPNEFKKTLHFVENLNKRLNHKIGGVLVSLLQVFPNSLLFAQRDKYKIKTHKKGVPYIISNITWNRNQLRLIYSWLKNFSQKSSLKIKGIEGGWTIEKRR
ncbi:MAG: cobalamin-dependent protein [Deltaproteobacteria bacterium]|nr:cobalamin-dependent protein [Deltaproteobacteria bacterium]